ncbi:hypothetical protein SteCoe_2011 [Stentor coeruleus]|uniref:Protein kinase domain-containing protein n=1 Tax=Stentor coeruleus TaxID=5963 RepID=A0A1R2D089_9CILI|nr:hypothetical protein SteCoe_2011 [Stentor coeruleus]
MSSSDLEEILNTRLFDAIKNKPNAVNSELALRGIQMTLNEIKQYNLNSADHDGKKFISALVLVKLEEEAPTGSSNINLFNYGIELIRLEPELKDLVTEVCDSILVSELSETINEVEALKWCIEGAKFKKASGKYLSGHDLGFVNITEILWTKSESLSINCNASELLTTLDFLLSAQRDANFDDLETLILTIGGIAINYIEDKNNLDGLGNENTQKDIQEAHRILDYLQQFKIDDADFRQEIAESRQKCIQIEPQIINIPNPMQFIDIPRDMNVDLSNIAIKYIPNLRFEITDQNIIYAYRWPNFQVSLHKAIYKNKVVTIKKYSEVANDSDIERINKEIKIYQVLSENRNFSNCFLEYFGTYLEQNGSINMVMEYQKETLALKINNMAAAQEGIARSETMIGTIFLTLITSFALMKNLGIIHGDIKPENFLVDENFNLKIIDFNISMVKNTDFINSAQQIPKSVGNVGFRAPELEDAFNEGLKQTNVNPEKSDVFSLGLVLLNFLTLEAVIGLNSTNKNPILMKKISELPIRWTQDLLKNMLQANPNNRTTFTQSLNFIPPSATPSIPR